MSEILHSLVAKKVLHQSLRVKKGENVTVETWNNGLPFALRVMMEARKLGCIPIMIFEDEDTFVQSVKRASKGHLGLMGKHEYKLLSGTDAYVFIPGPAIGAFYPRLTREEVSDATRYNSSWYDAAEKAKLRGVRLSFGYVGKDLAKLLGKSVREVVDLQLRAASIDLSNLREKTEPISRQLREGAQASIASDGMKLNFQLKGYEVIEDGIVDDQDVSDGNNMAYIPPGLVVKEVDKQSATGKVKISYAITRFGIITDAILEFEDGKLVSWRSRGSENRLNNVLTPISEKMLRAVSIGLNHVMKYGYAQDRFVDGAVAITGFGFTGIIKTGSMMVEGKTVVNKGRLAQP